jgi:RNA polymerase sigma-70 factor (ECF subfamily)
MFSVAAKRELEKLDDADLLARVAQRDLHAFEALMRRHNRLLFRTARGILRDDHESEDCVQEAYLLAYQHIASFRDESRLSTWLVRITANRALDRLRKRRRERNHVPLDNVIDLETLAPALHSDTSTQPDANLLRTQWRALLEDKIDRLPDAFRLVFILRAVEEMTVEEAAECLQIPPATVRTRFFRARGLLRESIASELDMAMDDVFEFMGERCDRIVDNVLRTVTGKDDPPPPPCSKGFACTCIFVNHATRSRWHSPDVASFHPGACKMIPYRLSKDPLFITGRRSFMFRSTGLLSAAAVALLAQRPPALAAQTKPGSRQAPAGDIQILSEALKAERQGIAAYQLGAESGLLQKPVLDLALQFQGHHKHHADLLLATIRQLSGTPPAEEKNYNFPREQLKSQADVLRFAAGLEHGAVTAYLNAIPNFADRDLSRAAGSILGDEAMHWAVLRHALGENPVPEAFVG